MICPECDSEVAHKPGCSLDLDMWKVLKSGGFDASDLLAALRSGIKAGEIDASLVDGDSMTVIVFEPDPTMIGDGK